jgi:hypothetical protein
MHRKRDERKKDLLESLILTRSQKSRNRDELKKDFSESLSFDPISSKAETDKSNASEKKTQTKEGLVRITDFSSKLQENK